MVYKEESNRLPRFNDGSLMAYTDIGLYTLYYLDRQNSVLCATCANKQEASEQEAARAEAVELESNFRELSEQEAEQVRARVIIPSGFQIIACGINYEDCNLFCDQCSANIPASYLTEADCIEQEAEQVASVEQEAAIPVWLPDNSYNWKYDLLEAEQVASVELEQWEIAAHSRIRAEAELAYNALPAHKRARKPYSLPAIVNDLIAALGLHDRAEAERIIKQLLDI